MAITIFGELEMVFRKGRGKWSNKANDEEEDENRHERRRRCTHFLSTLGD